jgi:hypothetical protein
VHTLPRCRRDSSPRCVCCAAVLPLTPTLRTRRRTWTR